MSETLPNIRASLLQLVRYGTVGLALNGIGYSVYLGLTYLGGNPMLVVSILYPVSVWLSYVLNRSWSFSYEGDNKSCFYRYLIAHAIGYGVNLVILYLFVTKLGFAHQLVQLVAIFLVAAMLFLLMKFYVYRSAKVVGMV